jgi:hypothetical protein
MNFEELKKMVSEDMSLDETELDRESLKIPQLHNKYLSLYHDTRMIARKYELEYREMRRKKWEYYSGRMTHEEMDEMGWEPFQQKVLRQDMDVFLNSDKDLNRIQAKLDYLREKCEYLESIVKSISARNWTIRNAIEWRKFTHGIN